MLHQCMRDCDLLEKVLRQKSSSGGLVSVYLVAGRTLKKNIAELTFSGSTNNYNTTEGT